MSAPEGCPQHTQEDRWAHLTLIEGEGKQLMGQTPAEFGVTPPTSDTFMSSNLLRKLESRQWVDKVFKAGSYGEVHEKTPLYRIIGEVFRKSLPDSERELALHLEAVASSEEAAYEAEGMATNTDYQAYLQDKAAQCSDTLLMQGFDAFLEAAYDFNNGLHADVIQEARLFATYLIDAGY